jgi:hypothetical protein
MLNGMLWKVIEGCSEEAVIDGRADEARPFLCAAENNLTKKAVFLN